MFFYSSSSFLVSCLSIFPDASAWFQRAMDQELWL